MKYFITLCFVFVLNSVYCQEFKIMFYNVENFFDTFDDPDKNDDGFTPNGENKWTRYRFLQKRNNIYKTIIAANKGVPHIIGLCEIENKYVLKQLTEQSPLAKYNYGIVHYDSPDRRGIDVALLYLKDSFNVISSCAHRLNIDTRDILYVKGVTNHNDTLHFFVNHWPSKWGGASSESSRMAAANVLKIQLDSIFKENINVNICVMGDFNDYPDSRPVKALGVKQVQKDEGLGYLYNMSLHLQDDHQGSIRFQNRWELIDLFLVSGNLLFGDTGLKCSFSDSKIFKADFLLEPVVGGGDAPKRTYRGPVYVGGFSDHLPITLTLSKQNHE